MPSPRPVTGIVVGLLVLSAIATSSTAQTSTITVTSTADDGSSGTLRQALSVATDGDMIDATGVSGTILLTGGELVVTKNVSIVGPGPANLAVNGNANGRVFHITAGTLVFVPVPTVSISGLTITNGFASGPAPANQGGGIWNDHAALTLSNCAVTGNSAAGPGGGIINDAFDHGGATLEIDNCTISNNSALCCTFSNNTTSCPGSSPTCYAGGGIVNSGGPSPGGAGATLTVTNSLITGNSAGFDGGGIENGNAAMVSNSTISGNSGAHGGGIYSTSGPLTVDSCTISGNSAGAGGGGVFNDYGGTPTVINSTISGNSSVLGGGGISSFARNSPPNSGPLTVSNSTISGNSYAQSDQGGGAIANAGDAMVINSTIGGNSGPNVGGGIVNFSYSLTVKDCTFSGNSAGGNSGNGGGAIFNWTGGTTQIGDTVLDVVATGAGGTLFNNSGAITSLGHNLSSDNGGGFLTATGDQISTDPLLDPAGLADNGGPTKTLALCTGPGAPSAQCTGASPAIDAGDPAFDPNSFNPPLTDDQRGSGYPRVVNGRVDIGAFEVQTAPTTTTTTTTNASSTTTTTQVSTTTTTTSSTTTTTTPPGKSKCTAKEFAAAAQKAAAEAKCHSKAVAKGNTSALQGCVGTAQSTFSGAYSKATNAGNCRTPTGAGTVEMKVDALIADLDTTLVGGSTMASKCTAKEWKAAGAKAASKLRCDAEAASKGVMPSSKCLQAADTTFTGAFGKATKRSGCLTSADVTTVEGNVDSFVNDLAATLAP